MDRLTYRGTPRMTEDGIITPSYSDYPIRRIIERLTEYEDAEEQGLLLRLPCKVGDKYYRIHRFCSMCGYENKETFHPTRGDCELWCECNHKNPCDKENRIVEYTFECLETIINNAKDIGTSLFLTREEAEKAMAEMG